MVWVSQTFQEVKEFYNFFLKKHDVPEELYCDEESLRAMLERLADDRSSFLDDLDS